MQLVCGVMMVRPKKESDKRKFKKAYCDFCVTLHRPWKSRGGKLNAYNTAELPLSYTQGSSKNLLDPDVLLSEDVDAVAYLKQLRAGRSSAPSSTSVVEEKCHVGSDDACKE